VPKLIGLDLPAKVWVEAVNQDLENPSSPPKPCRLCAQPIGAPSSQPICFSALAASTNGVREFFLDPHAEVVDISADGSGRNAVFFTAEQYYGGSGSLNLLTLLVFSPSEKALESLLPPILRSNLSEYRFWPASEVSPYKLLTVAEFEWVDGEAHVDEHRYRVRTYAYQPAARKYAQIDKYVTAKKYLVLDSWDELKVLAGEESTLRARLKKAASQPR
jgi:hypothetical protein